MGIAVRPEIKAALMLTLFAALPAAAGSFSPPPGCETWLTVQSRACRVSNHYTCTADPSGDKWRADFDQEGMFFVSRIDSEAQWVESYDVSPPVRQVLESGATDPASFSDLLAGRDDYDFRLSRSDGQRSHVTGYDALTGKSLVIDGITLQQTEFDFTEVDEDGNVLRRARGNEYVHPEWRLFFAGPSEWQDGENWLPVDGSPVQFIFPGEPGFRSTQPIFECGALMSSYPKSSQATEAQSHDDL